jgi:transposase-like protein
MIDFSSTRLSLSPNVFRTFSIRYAKALAKGRRNAPRRKRRHPGLQNLSRRASPRSIHSVNPLERLNREIRRRERVVGVFPDRASVYRLIGTQLVNVDEDWRFGRRYMAKKDID